MKNLIKISVATTLSISLYANNINEEIAAKEYDAQKLADIIVKLNVMGDKSKKPNHHKGFCVGGVFKPDSNINEYFNIELFKQKSIPVNGRVSLGGGELNDKSKARGLAIKLEGDNDNWTMVMLSNPINFAKTLKEFGYFHEMQLPDENGNVNKEKIKQAFSEVQSFKNFAEYTKNIGFSKSVANTQFYSVHTFFFDDKNNNKFPARWTFKPKDGVKFLSEEEIKTTSNDYLAKDFQEKIKNAPIEYELFFTLPNENDELYSTNALWQGEHKQIFAGTLQLTQYNGLDCNLDVYFPWDMAKGVYEPKDELFIPRNEAYVITFGYRQ
ncbi:MULTISPECIES: catalase [unclassified Campylobacter]|uniref:catalase n=1 Tax=unclassified Campylobacter TaxID=2593542 RepID=UPI001BDA2F4C|nr:MULTISPECIES: catalase [unclassified Campylobacter]MBT0880010.1 catalase [Campylobacter sp. 2018MI27]MBT0885312.1 catalase [Campylobacter sp. 2018MI10]MBZ7993410.1 catalase [Campylobacter sp. RM9333]